MNNIEKKDEVTIKRLDMFYGDVSAAINWVYEQRILPPDKPSRPYIDKTATSAQAREYATLLDKYESDMVKYKEEVGEYQKKVNGVNAVIEQYIKQEAGLTNVPEQYRDKLYSYACSRGHSSGYYDVYNVLCDLVNIFT